jgi:probable HAF family extracellular repeat protein
MDLGDRTSIRRGGTAAIVTAVFAALALASSAAARGQDTGDSAGEAMAPAGMPMMGMMGAPSDDGDTAPLTGHGYLLDKGVFTTIDHPDAVGETVASDINNRGQIVGQYIDADGTEHGFLLDDGVFTTIDHPDASPIGTAAIGLNDRGQIVGFYAGADGANHGFLLDKGRGFRREGVFTTIDHPDAGSLPGTGTAVTAIDDGGRIVGFYFDATPMPHGFVRDNGRGARRDDGDFIPIDHPDAGAQPGTGTLAVGLNDRGQIVGGYVDADGRGHGFLLDDGEFTTIDHPDAASEPRLGTVLFGINNRRQIVGQYIDTDLRCHGLLRSRSTFTTIDDPGTVSHTGALGINDRGQIVGFSDARTGFVACFQEASASASDPGSAAE